MSTDHEFHLMQLSDSFFPSGMFGLSNGLESLVKHHVVRDEGGVLDFIERQIRFQMVPCDCMIFLAAMEAAEHGDIGELANLDDVLFSMRLVSGARSSSVRSGSQIINCVAQISGRKGNAGMAGKFQRMVAEGRARGTYPVCLGIASSVFGIPPESGMRMMLYSFSQSIAAAAIRLGIIDHVAGQKILLKLSGRINTISKNVKKEQLEGIWQLTPETDIFQMIHEQDNSRMFIT